MLAELENTHKNYRDYILVQNHTVVHTMAQ
jgi:hypothetical protein